MEGSSPCHLLKPCKSPQLMRSLRLLQLGQGRRCLGSKREDCTVSGARKGVTMHKYPQNQSHVGSSGQTLTTNVSMTLPHPPPLRMHGLV